MALTFSSMSRRPYRGVSGVGFRHAEPFSGASAPTLSAFANRGGFDTVRRAPGALAMPGLNRQVNDYVSRDMQARASTAQGQLDPNRFGHITGAPPVSLGSPKPTLLPPGTQMGGGSMVANIDGRQVLLPPTRSNDYAGYTPAAQASLRAEDYRNQALGSPNSPLGRAYSAGRAGLATQNLNDRQLAISALGHGRIDSLPDGMKPMTDVEQRRVDRMQSSGVRLPGYSLPMPQERADAIRADAGSRRRTARGLPSLRPPSSDTEVRNAAPARGSMGSPPAYGGDKNLAERSAALTRASDTEAIKFLQDELEFDPDNGTFDDAVMSFYDAKGNFGEQEVTEFRSYLQARGGADPAFRKELDSILNKSGKMRAGEELNAYNMVRQMFGREPLEPIYPIGAGPEDDWQVVPAY